MIELTLPVISVIVLVSVLQSLFGVGVLLFGTPLLLLLGYEFVVCLHLLLPVSLSINLLQIWRHHREVDMAAFRAVLIYSIPLVVAGLCLVIWLHLKVDGVIGCLLIMVALKNLMPGINRALLRLMKFERTFLMVMGAVHGLSNLGGSLLVVFVHSRNYKRDKSRVTTALIYSTFVVFQLVTLSLARTSTDVHWMTVLLYVAVAALVFWVVEAVFYSRINPERYRLGLTGFILASGLLLVSKQIGG